MGGDTELSPKDEKYLGLEIGVCVWYYVFAHKRGSRVILRGRPFKAVPHE